VCPLNYTANNATGVCEDNTDPVEPVPSPQIDLQTSSSDDVVASTAYPVSYLVAAFFFVLLLTGLSKLTRPDSHLTYPAFMSLVSAVEFASRLASLIVLWEYAGIEVAVFVAISAGVLLGGVVLSLMFQVLYFEPVCESSSSLEILISQYKHPFAFLKRFSVLFGIHFHRIFYSGLFGLEVFNNPKTIGSVSAFRLPLEKLCLLHVVAINVPALLQQTAVVALYPTVTDPFQVGLFGLVLNLGLSGLFLADWRRSEWRA
jgi:hypothetical protein